MIRRKSGRRAGFTLIELSVVIFMIGAIMLTVLPSVAKLFTPGAQEEALVLHDAVKFCYRRSMLNQKTIFLELNVDTEEYQILEIERDENGLHEKPIFETKELPSSSAIVDVMDARGYRYVKGKVRIPFSPTGVAEDFYIHLGPDPEIKRTLIVRRYGGKSEIKEGEETISDENLEWYKQSEFDGSPKL
ncbi:prepilin-type cleavage/methylation domain-containing protein [Leptospira perolatii]|uniref:Prepilin-type cleavage/methylation domain-containing protein n=1 Tax=Leptospira perolatii TaxID=2023191 RepID=A0A2M9ZIH2_9LEPT|nr:type II secretion system protein [Leptospira perolatii]PJZ68526.1 prepilin-type cleavage/methylation domain-containing protein [Leptospira perolatii]PJZ71856.1 prepilin-type cleavage/methylation domain-containing protein [Leptospira perolatii]